MRSSPAKSWAKTGKMAPPLAQSSPPGNEEQGGESPREGKGRPVRRFEKTVDQPVSDPDGPVAPVPSAVWSRTGMDPGRQAMEAMVCWFAVPTRQNHRDRTVAASGHTSHPGAAIRRYHLRENFRRNFI